MNLLPPPTNGGPQASGAGDHGGHHHNKGEIPDEEQLLHLLLHLNGLVTLRIVAPAQANVIQRTLFRLLDHHKHKRSEKSAALDQEAIADLYKTDPKILNLLEPFLSNEQVAWILKQGKDAP